MRTRREKYDLNYTPNKMVGSFYILNLDKKDHKAILNNMDGVMILSRKKNIWDGVEVVKFKVDKSGELIVYPDEYAKINIFLIKENSRYLYTAPASLIRNVRSDVDKLYPQKTRRVLI